MLVTMADWIVSSCTMKSGLSEMNVQTVYFSHYSIYECMLK